MNDEVNNLIKDINYNGIGLLTEEDVIGAIKKVPKKYWSFNFFKRKYRINFGYNWVGEYQDPNSKSNVIFRSYEATVHLFPIVGVIGNREGCSRLFKLTWLIFYVEFGKHCH